MDLQTISTHHASQAVELLLARSDFLDAFALLESCVLKVLRSCGNPAKGEPFAHRVKAFRLAEKTTLIARSNYPQRDLIADEIAALLPVRADIVHSKMAIATINDEIVATFVNAQDADTPFPQSRTLSISQLKQLIGIVNELVKRVGLLNRVNPASSPPPPSPGAAGDP